MKTANGDWKRSLFMFEERNIILLIILYILKKTANGDWKRSLFLFEERNIILLIILYILMKTANGDWRRSLCCVCRTVHNVVFEERSLCFCRTIYFNRSLSISYKFLLKAYIEIKKVSRIVSIHLFTVSNPLFSFHKQLIYRSFDRGVK